jgi:ubiquinone/menaquinone biosynthesis C-methylase UbiE
MSTRPHPKPRSSSSRVRSTHSSKPRAAAANTSWEKSAAWYDKLIGEKGSNLYQQIDIPGALKLLAPTPQEHILDIGCGQGVFSRAIAAQKAKVTGIDAAPSLIQSARQYPGNQHCNFETRDAADLIGLGPFNAATAILCLQNMDHLPRVCQAVASVLKPGARFLWVLNHPCFRIPRQTAWGFDEDRKIQYRRLDAYSSPMAIPIIMHPGQKDSESTTSFHRSLTDLFAPAFQAGFQLQAIQEWHSPKQSQPGPRAKAENRARNEFPLFMALLWTHPSTQLP